MYKNIQGGGGQPNFDFTGEAEKAARSVFVGNIPYEATEEQLKAIFAEIGVVLSFRLVYDRETGKPKGNFIIYIRSFFWKHCGTYFWGSRIATVACYSLSLIDRDHFLMLSHF